MQSYCGITVPYVMESMFPHSWVLQCVWWVREIPYWWTTPCILSWSTLVSHCMITMLMECPSHMVVLMYQTHSETLKNTFSVWKHVIYHMTTNTQDDLSMQTKAPLVSPTGQVAPVCVHVTTVSHSVQPPSPPQLVSSIHSRPVQLSHCQ